MRTLRLIGERLPASSVAVDELCLRLRQLLVASISPERRFAIELVAREALENAVEHGCHGDPAKRLSFEFWTEGDGLRLVVEDEGEGFDVESAFTRADCGELEPCGNGLALIKAYSDSFTYEAGGRRLVASFLIEEDRIMIDESAEAVWKPGRDLTAPFVSEAKADIKKRVESSQGEFVIDLEGVEMVDSKGLGLIIATLNTLSTAGRALMIRNPAEDIVQLLKLMRLDRHLRIE